LVPLQRLVDGLPAAIKRAGHFGDGAEFSDTVA
jgi:hypothetical protein